MQAFTIGELARVAGVNVETIRCYDAVRCSDNPLGRLVVIDRIRQIMFGASSSWPGRSYWEGSTTQRVGAEHRPDQAVASASP